MALFRCASGSSGGGATITVTYSSDFYGETVTCSHGTKTYSKVATSSGTLEFSVDEEGTWTISCTIGSDTFTTTADVDLTYDAELVSLPNGETVLPTDDIETWLACAAITDKSYTTLSQVLGDSETYNALLGDSNACAYMKRSTTWSTDICASQYAMMLLGQYDTACDALLSDSTWASAIANSTYWESVLQPLIPKMTSNTAPSGTASTNFPETTKAYYIFDGDTSSVIPSTSPTSVISGGVYIEYEFASPIKACKAILRASTGSSSISTMSDVMEQAYVNGAWVDLDNLTLSGVAAADYSSDFSVVETSKVRVFKENYTAVSSYKVYGNFFELQFYGRTTSSEKVHGANGESAYILDDGSPVTVADPSTLDAGTYTVYSTVAKDPDNLSNDYSKTVRICPNTKEIVVRPDNSLYWRGYENPNLEDLSSANGWSFSGYSFNAPTHNQQSISMPSASSKIVGVGSKLPFSATTLYTVVNGVTPRSGGTYIYLNKENSKTLAFNTQNEVKTAGVSTQTLAWDSDKYACVQTDSSANSDLYAMWYE